jgi:hypothetical protein
LLSGTREWYQVIGRPEKFTRFFESLRDLVVSPFGRTKLTPTAIVDDLRSQGFTSVRAIADQLNERGILAPSGGGWHSTSAARLLSRLKRDGRRTDNGSPPRPGLPEKTSASCFRKSR